jgi:hypothetical protein
MTTATKKLKINVIDVPMEITKLLLLNAKINFVVIVEWINAVGQDFPHVSEDM